MLATPPPPTEARESPQRIEYARARKMPQAAGVVRELLIARWGLPGAPQFGGQSVTNIRNLKRLHGGAGWPRKGAASFPRRRSASTPTRSRPSLQQSARALCAGLQDHDEQTRQRQACPTVQAPRTSMSRAFQTLQLTQKRRTHRGQSNHNFGEGPDHCR